MIARDHVRIVCAALIAWAAVLAAVDEVRSEAPAVETDRQGG